MPTYAKSSEVDTFIAESIHALKDCLQPLREIIHSANAEITEQIKWKCPSFCFEGDDRITYNLSKKDQLLIIFHTGASGKGKTPDKLKFKSYTILEWLASDRACIKINKPEDLKNDTNQIIELVSLWLQETKC